ncbi:MAG: hypothetical protein CSA50_08015 [Gammaproteobacteria bacterium]|nr:MAG: hypothetical protein CSA50_08015 [Gammaproteobacteria bacterium]
MLHINLKNESIKNRGFNRASRTKKILIFFAHPMMIHRSNVNRALIDAASRMGNQHAIQGVLWSKFHLLGELV